jgi:phosphoribosylformylglycinamidine synthase
LTRTEQIGNKNKQKVEVEKMIAKLVRNFGLYEVCFYIEMISEMTLAELQKLRWVIAETFEPLLTGDRHSYSEGSFVEIGPRLNVETPFSTNAVAICHAMGLDKVVRIEQSKIYKLDGATREEILAQHLDQMT